MGLAAYLRELKNKPDISEIGLYTPFATHIVGDVLGYPPEDYHIAKPAERPGPDLRLFGEDRAVWVVGEIKLDDLQIRTPARRQRLWRTQVKPYIRPETVYLLLAARHTVYVCDLFGKPLAGAHFEGDRVVDAIANRDHPLTDHSLRTVLHLVSHEESHSRSQYARFRAGELRSGYLRLDDASLPLFEEVFQYATEVLVSYAREAWEALQVDYQEFLAKQADIEDRIANWADNPKTRDTLEGRLVAARRQHRLARQLFEEDYPQFERRQAYAGTREKQAFEDIFLTDTVYIVLSRLLFVRLCEDLGFVKRKVSNGGIAVWRDLTTNIRERYQDLLEVAFKDAESVYTRLFEPTVFEWYTRTNRRLDALLERILYRLNAFAFDRVDRDLLGQIYQHFLPRKKRKRLGEFYTDDELVDYILHRTGITSDSALTEKRALDPACGSYTFGVRMVRHVLDRGASLSAADQIDAVRRVLIGFDINPFATFIAQMSLLFALLPLYKQAKQEDPSYRLPDFNVYAVNSLVRPDSQTSAEAGLPETPETAMAEALGWYDYVIGNPPYVRNERIPAGDRAAVEASFADIRRGNTDLAAYFVHRAVADWLKPDTGMLGMVVSLGLANSASAEKLRHFLRLHEVVELVSLEWMATELFEGTDVVPMLLFVRPSHANNSDAVRDRPVRLVAGLRSKADLRKAATSRAFYRAHSHEIRRQEWESLSPFGDWCLEVIPQDVPIIQKLRALPTLESAGVAKAQYGVKVGSQPKGGGLLIPADDSRASREHFLPFHKGDDVCAFGLSPADDLIDTRSLAPRFLETEAAFPRADDPSVWAWWDAGGPDAVAEGGQGSLGLRPRLIPSDRCVVVVPGVYVTLVAGLLDPTTACSNNSTILGVPLACSAAALASFVNSLISRYYAFLTMRAGILLRRRSTIYPRTLDSLPCPPVGSGVFDVLDSLGTQAMSLAQLVDTDEVDVFLGEMAAMSDLMPAKLLPKMDFSGWGRGEVPAEVLAQAAVGDDGLRLAENAVVKGDPDALVLLCCAARAVGSAVAPAQAGNIELPREGSERKRIAAAIRAHLEARPRLRQQFQDAEKQINDVMLEALGLTEAKRQYLLERCQQFPLSDTVMRPRYLWSEDRKQQARRRYAKDVRYR
jgi:hypothetical protein